MKQIEKHGTQYISLLKRASIGSLFIKVAGAGNEFILSVILARVLGVNEYGAYVLSLTWVMILATLATMGFDSAAIRFIPEYVIKKKMAPPTGPFVKIMPAYCYKQLRSLIARYSFYISVRINHCGTFTLCICSYTIIGFQSSQAGRFAGNETRCSV